MYHLLLTLQDPKPLPSFYYPVFTTRMIPCYWNWIPGFRLQNVQSCLHDHHRPRTAFHQIKINNILLNKTIRVAQPDVVKWYQEQFLYGQHGDQNETFMTLGLVDQTEPLDLSIRNNEDDDATATATTLTKNDDDDNSAAAKPPIVNYNCTTSFTEKCLRLACNCDFGIT